MESEGENYSNNNGMYRNKDYPKSLEKKKILKPIRQEKIVKVPVTEYVEKIVEQEEIKYVNKYVDVIKPIITYKTKHVPKPIYLDKIRYETKVIEKEKIIHIPKIQYKNKIVEVPVYVHREKIIEKKVPLIIERVVPVLNVKKMQKDVYIDSIDVPEISEIKNKERKENHYPKIYIQKKENSMNKMMDHRKGSISSSIKINENESENMNTYRLNGEIGSSNINSSIQRIIEQNYKNKEEIGSESSRDNTENDSRQGDLITHKHETKYHDSIMREPMDDVYSENNSRMMNNNEKREEINYLGEENFFQVKSNEHYNISSANENLPEYENEGIDYSEHRSTNEYEQNYHVSINKIQSNHNNNNNNNSNNVNTNVYDKTNMYLGNNLNNHNKSVSEQIIRNESVIGPVDQKLHYSFPSGRNYQENFENNKIHMEMEQNYNNSNYANIQIPNDTNSTQNVQMFDYNKQNAKPAYANSNGQTMVSVRPATIVEYKPKPKKFKNPVCNFLNNCCGGK